MNVTINGIEVNVARLEITLIGQSPEQIDEHKTKLIENANLQICSMSPITTTCDTDRRYKVSMIFYDGNTYLV